jgi:hypothetical protein
MKIPSGDHPAIAVASLPAICAIHVRNPRRVRRGSALGCGQVRRKSRHTTRVGLSDRASEARPSRKESSHHPGIRNLCHGRLATTDRRQGVSARFVLPILLTWFHATDYQLLQVDATLAATAAIAETFVSFFRAMGPHITLDADGREIGYVDAFRLLEYCRRHDEENGLDQSYLDKITR